MEKLLNAQEVAKTLGVCRTTALALMEQMNPVNVAIKPGKRQLRVRPEDLEQFITRQQAPTVPIVRKQPRKRPVLPMPYMDEDGLPMLKKDGKFVPARRRAVT